MIVIKRNWSVVHTHKDGCSLQVRPSETDSSRVYVSAVDPEVDVDENVEFDMTIEELEAFVKAARTECDAAMARTLAEAKEAVKSSG